jgi:hypothetical protein
MAHVRKQIRDAAVTLLTGLTTTGSRVHPNRLLPLKETDLPCLLVYTDDEDVQPEGIGELVLDRNLRLTVRGVAKQTADLDDTLDAMLEEVETVLNGAAYGGLAKQTALVTVRVQQEYIQEKPVGVIDMGFTVNYFTTGSAPGTAI